MNQDFIITYSKQRFSPLRAKAEDIRIADIAHALSLLCRANGHIRHFYSVAQHSLNCSREAEARRYSADVQLACLLHDASEAYISDITRPVKRNLPEYLVIEEALQKQIYASFQLSHLEEADFALVKAVDDSLLFYEMLDLMGEEIFEVRPELIRKPDLALTEFRETEEAFLDAFRSLTSVLCES